MPIGTAGISTISGVGTDTVGAARTVASNSTTPSEVYDRGATSSQQTFSSNIETMLNERLATARTQEDVHLERIIVLDDTKNEYVNAISGIDDTLLSIVENVNGSIQDVNTAYQARINSGCRTDLFWRLVDIQGEYSTESIPGGARAGVTTTIDYTYTYQCYRINPSGYVSVGAPPSDSYPGFRGGFNFGDGPSFDELIVGVSTTTVEYVADTNGTHASVPLNDLFGFQPINLYGLKMYDEPLTKDIGDTFVTSFIGTCGVGTNVVIAMTPLISGGISNIKAGQLLTCDKLFAFNSDAYVITGVGTATANLSGINTLSPASSVSEVVVPKLTLDDVTVQPVFAPEDDGKFVTFTVLSDPNTLTNLALKREDSPYVPQIIKCPMTRSDRGKGIRIEFDNSGAPAGSPSWNQYFEGQTDPDAKINGNSEAEIRQKMNDNIVREPACGAGIMYHKLGFTVAPVVYTDSGRNEYRFATEGETVVLRSRMGQPSSTNKYFSFIGADGPQAGVVELPTCSASVESSITTAQATSTNIISGISSSSIQTSIEMANMLRDDLTDINVRIWSERQLLGDAIDRQGTYTKRLSDVQTNRDIIDGV
jgi:hypothetical protein